MGGYANNGAPVHVGRQGKGPWWWQRSTATAGAVGGSFSFGFSTGSAVVNARLAPGAESLPCILQPVLDFRV